MAVDILQQQTHGCGFLIFVKLCIFRASQSHSHCYEHLKAGLSIRLKPFSILCGFYDGVSMFWSSFTYCTETQEDGISCAVSQVTAVCIWLRVGSGSAAAAQCSCRHSFILWVRTLTCSHGQRCPEERSGSVRRGSSPSKLYKIPTCIYKAVQNNLNDLRLLCFHFSKAVLYLSYFLRAFQTSPSSYITP